MTKPDKEQRRVEAEVAMASSKADPLVHSSGPKEPETVVVVIGRLFSVPPEAGTPRPFHLLTRLRDRARLLGVAVVADLEPACQRFIERPEIAALFDRSWLFHRRTSSSALAHVRTLLAGRPPFDLRYKDPDTLASVHKRMHDLVRDEGPLVFYCLGLPSLQWIPEQYWQATLLDAIDAMSMATARRIKADQQISPIAKLGLRLALPAQQRYEGTVLARLGAVVYNSSLDVEYMRRLCPGAPIRRVIDGVDASYFSPEASPEVEEGDEDILFFGDMTFAPNLDAAHQLVEHIMPLVWSRCKNARAILIGPDPPESLRRLHDGQRVIVTGFVDDLRPYLKRCAVVASPLRFGAGMKNKLQAGLAMRKAMVVSTVTVEGFDDLEPGRHAIVADEPGQFAEAVTELLQDRTRRREMAEAGRVLILRSYTWESASRALWEAFGGCELASAPRKNC